MISEPRSFIVDKPFLLILRETGGKPPYFAMWVANGEVMEMAESDRSE